MEKGKKRGGEEEERGSFFYGRKKKKPWQLGGSIQTSLRGSSWHNVVGEEVYIYISWFLDAKLNDRYLDRTLNELLSHKDLPRHQIFTIIFDQFSLARLIILILIFLVTLNVMFENRKIITSVKVLLALKVKFEKNPLVDLTHPLF